MTKYLVKHQPISRLANATISVVAAFAWLLAANHCAIAAFVPATPGAASGHEHCSSQQKAPTDEKKERDCDGSKCCKALSTPTSALAKSVVKFDLGLHAAVSYPAAAHLARSDRHHACILELDTGPPGRRSFAESVLQRSLLAHAPPSLS